jgi:hypothetical protein
MMNNALKIKGTVELVLRGPDGRIKDRRLAENVVTDAGRAHIIDRLQAASAAVCDYIAIGTTATAEDHAQTALIAEAARGQGDLSQPDHYTDRCVETFAAGTGTGTIVEAGRLNAGSSGTLMGRAVFTGIVKGALDSLQITYDFTYVAG